MQLLQGRGADMNTVHSGHRERLREQYTESGIDSFADHQILELLLTYAIPRRDTNETAHALLERFGTLEKILQADVLQLMGVPGIGQNAAVFLRMQGDISRRIQLQQLSDKRGRIRLTSPLESARFATALLLREPYETVYAVCLNKSNHVGHWKNITQGTLIEAPVYPRLIVEYALLQRAHSIIMLHNHPSGNPAPSKEDFEATDTMRAALASVDIPLLDHLITAGQCVYSFSANAILLLPQGAADPITMTVEEYEEHIKKERTNVGEEYPQHERRLTVACGENEDDD